MPENVIHDYIAGAVGGSLGLLVGHPFDTIKVELQTKSLNTRGFSRIIEAVSRIHQQGLIRGFFRGVSWPLLSYGFVNSILFGVYGNVLKLMESNREKRKSSYFNIYIAGCIGGAVQLLPVIPIDYIKVVLQSQVTHRQDARRQYFTGPLQCALHVRRTKGLRGLYKGGCITACRDIPSFGLYILLYEYISDVMKTKGWTDSKGFFAELVAGGLTGSISWFVVMPLDVIKSRYQADMSNLFKGSIDCAVRSYRSHGITVFYRGCLVTCLRGFPVNAVTFLVYTRILKYLSGDQSLSEGEV